MITLTSTLIILDTTKISSITVYKQTIICRQLLAVHVVGVSANGKEEKENDASNASVYN